MKLFLVSLALGLGLLLPVSGYAAEAPAKPEASSSDFLDSTGFTGYGRVGVNLISVGSNTNSDNHITFMPGLGAQYYFVPRVGLFLEAQLNPRGYGVAGITSNATYIDVPFGFTFSTGSGMFNLGSRNHFRLGGYVAVPTGDFTGALALPFSNKAQSFMGIYVGSDSHFWVADHFAMGFGTWVKIGLGSAISSTVASSTFIELGLGLTLAVF